MTDTKHKFKLQSKKTTNLTYIFCCSCGKKYWVPKIVFYQLITGTAMLWSTARRDKFYLVDVE